MSARFWMVGAGVALCGALGGFGLGSFAGGRYDGGPWRDSPAHAYPEDRTDTGNPLFSGLRAHADTGVEADAPPAPAEIVCKGCGPTLAERQMTGDAFLTGAGDPVLRDYEAGERAPADMAKAAPPQVVTTLRPAQQGTPSHPAVQAGDDIPKARE